MKNTLLKAIYESGKIILENFGGTFRIESKDSVSNLVTEVDKKSEDAIIQIIIRDFPGHSLLSEEIGAIDSDSGMKWIIDPIDGTINYAHAIPLCCVSIGIEKNKEIVMGAVYNPMSGELFFAEKGQGAFLNDKAISVSEESNFNKSLLVTGFPYNTSKNPNNPVGVFANFLLQDIPIRRLGSAALDICWTACGRFDGFWEYNLNAWDVAAGFLIIKEAGGVVTDFKGEEYSVYKKEILASNGKIHNEMMAVIRSAVKD
ncbi:MAG: inositol monophosphatase family protein [Ignavibacteriae bacterium]|nr:inositol monophosphatase family protein [Ignavibacteriota bacterium]